MLKALVTGKLSLAKTFWGWGFGGTALIVAISKAGVYAGQYWLLPVSHVLQALLSLAVLSGVTFILKEKHTFRESCSGAWLLPFFWHISS
ncbi:hypothetical protein [Pantoea stewartii]|uniref:hypothetical protein n=1 Tax=Pantoea stewartii TaxID=66269 RepID=UPI00249F77A5|nr:hypothetical protein [Pantoea stewartii]